MIDVMPVRPEVRVGAGERATRTRGVKARRSGWRPRWPGDFPTLGWSILDWTFAFLPSPADETQPFRYTDEQARRVLRIYELDPLTGARRYGRRVHEEEAKGWGKSPFAASLALVEFAGPVLFDGWDADGQPVARPWGTGGSPVPWIQIAAVSEAQTENTWHAVYGFLTRADGRAADALHIDVGRTLLYRRDVRDAKMERVTASAGSREGQVITHAVLDEPQLWTPRNAGDVLADTIKRNLTKTNGWAHFTGNAPVLGMDSVAETHRDPAPGVLHFATRPDVIPEEHWSPDRKLWAIRQVYRDVPWMDPMRVLADVLDPVVPWANKLRFTYNTPVSDTPENAWMDPALWDAAAGDVVMRPDLRTYAAVRIGHDHRSAAVAVAQRQGSKVALRVRAFPSRVLPDREYLPIAEVESYIRSLRARYPAPVIDFVKYSPKGKEYPRARPGPEILHHGAFFEPSAQALRADGLVLRDTPSTHERLTPAAESLMQLITAGDLVHDGNRQLARQIGRVVAEPAPKGWRIGVADDGLSGAMVAAHAAMLAVDRALNAAPPQDKALRQGL